MTMTASLSFSCQPDQDSELVRICFFTDYVCYDAGQQKALLMLVRRLLIISSEFLSDCRIGLTILDGYP
jgi:hypothetical protein